MFRKTEMPSFFTGLKAQEEMIKSIVKYGLPVSTRHRVQFMSDFNKLMSDFNTLWTNLRNSRWLQLVLSEKDPASLSRRAAGEP